MKLYDGGRAPNPRRVQIFMAEKGITVPTVQIDINKLEQKSEDFTRINPMQRVPVLVLEDGTAIAETVAICRYFEETRARAGADGAQRQGKGACRNVAAAHGTPVPAAGAMAFRHLHPGGAHLERPQVPNGAR